MDSKNTEPPRLMEEDIEKLAHDTSYLKNTVVDNLSWSGVTVTVQDRERKAPKEILTQVNGYAAAGMS
jgi:hypothetical protein